MLYTSKNLISTHSGIIIEDVKLILLSVGILVHHYNSILFLYFRPPMRTSSMPSLRLRPSRRLPSDSVMMVVSENLDSK